VPPAGYLEAAGRIAHAHGALLWLDEVQTGVGRTGHWFAHQDTSLHGTVVPDVVTLAKGLGGGIPIGACIGVGEAGGLLQPGNHGTTFGGNPVATAAALAVLRVVEEEGLLDHATKLGERIRDGLDPPGVTEVRGAGLLIGLDLDPVDGSWAKQVATVAAEQGFILNDCTPDRIRLAPPLNLTEAQADELLTAWPMILQDARPAPEEDKT
jgi:acetylornithine aminotransferase